MNEVVAELIFKPTIFDNDHLTSESDASRTEEEKDGLTRVLKAKPL
jgi:hypothetical protein